MKTNGNADGRRIAGRFAAAGLLALGVILAVNTGQSVSASHSLTVTHDPPESAAAGEDLALQITVQSNCAQFLCQPIDVTVSYSSGGNEGSVQTPEPGVPPGVVMLVIPGDDVREPSITYGIAASQGVCGAFGCNHTASDSQGPYSVPVVPAPGGDIDGDGVPDGEDNCPATANSGQQNTVHPNTSAGDHCEDAEPDLIFDISDNCPDTANPGQENFDGDSSGDPCDDDDDNDGDLDGSDPDDDNDEVFDIDEASCGGSTPSNLRPERLDTPGDDDGDMLANESLPVGSEGFDCDGDGWKGDQENLIFDDAPGTGRDQDPCGSDGWAGDLTGDNRLSIADINSFLSPSRPDGSHNKFDHPLDDDGNTVIDAAMARWNLLTPPHTASETINIGDLNALITGAVGSGARPAMFGGQPAFFTNGGTCPYPA